MFKFKCAIWRSEVSAESLDTDKYSPLLVAVREEHVDVRPADCVPAWKVRRLPHLPYWSRYGKLWWVLWICKRIFTMDCFKFRISVIFLIFSANQENRFLGKSNAFSEQDPEFRFLLSFFIVVTIWACGPDKFYLYLLVSNVLEVSEHRSWKCLSRAMWTSTMVVDYSVRRCTWPRRRSTKKSSAALISMSTR